MACVSPVRRKINPQGNEVALPYISEFIKFPKRMEAPHKHTPISNRSKTQFIPFFDTFLLNNIMAIKIPIAPP